MSVCVCSNSLNPFQHPSDIKTKWKENVEQEFGIVKFRATQHFRSNLKTVCVYVRVCVVESEDSSIPP